MEFYCMKSISDLANTIGIALHNLKSSLSSVAFSGSYNDLSDKPSELDDSDIVHISSDETITGNKTFQSDIILEDASLVIDNGENKQTSFYEEDGKTVINNNDLSKITFDNTDIRYIQTDETDNEVDNTVYHSGMFVIDEYVKDTEIEYPTLGTHTPENMQQFVTEIADYASQKVLVDASAIHYRGSVEDIDALEAIEEPQIGDMYNVGGDISNGNYAWNGTEWDSLGDTINLNLKANDDSVVHTTTNETIRGVKTFMDFPEFKGVVPCDASLGKNKLSIKTNSYIQLGEIGDTTASGFMIVRKLLGDLYPQLANVTQRSKVEMSSTGGFKCSIMTAGKGMDEAHFMFDATRIIWYGSGKPGTAYPSNDWNKGYQLYHENIVPKMIDDISAKLSFPDINGEECSGLQDWINKISAAVNALQPTPPEEPEPEPEVPSEEPTE